MKIIITIFSIAILLAFEGCKKGSLDVENQNEPDFLKVYSNGNDLEKLASNLYNTLYQSSHNTGSGVETILAVASDNISCSWGNFAMRDMSWEPRNNGWNNSPSYQSHWTTYNYFNNMYSVINTASNILTAMASGIQIGPGGADNERTKAICKFAQGIAYSNLALTFDKAFIVDEKIKIEKISVEKAVPFADVEAAALAYLNEAIDHSANTFTVPAAWLGTDVDLSNVDFKKLCNTYAARLLAYSPRNKKRLAAVNWSLVKTYADAGIEKDFNVVMDNYVKWYDRAGDTLTLNGWGVTDMYVVNMMDPATQPQHWDDVATFPYPKPSTNPLDKRLFSDFQYVASNWFQVARGYYHFSSYRLKRYDALYTNATGPKGEVMKTENDMIRAEARAYTGDLDGAAAIINTGTRKTRGKMPDVDANLASIIAAIHHERHVEMMLTGNGIQFYEMRKLDLLQKGTPLHFPLPAKTLETFGLPLPFYTFGGTANADGVNVSNGGWR